jgi:hypothetical protein
MRKILGSLFVLLIVFCLFGAVAHASILRTYTQPGYNVKIEYYAETGDMFFQYLYDKGNNLIVIGIDNEKCFVYGEWDTKTGNAKQARNENGEEYVVGVHSAPATSKLYPIPNIVYRATAERKAEFEKNNPQETSKLDPNGIPFNQVFKGLISEPGDNRDKWDAAEKGYELHPILPISKDKFTGANSKTQRVLIIYVTFEGASKLMDGAVQLHPSYFNDLMFSNKEWRPYIDSRSVSKPAAADKFSYTFLSNSTESSRDNIVPSPTAKGNFDRGIYHGSTAHFLYYGSNKKYTIEPALDSYGEGGIVEIIMPESWNRAYDISGVGNSFGKPPIPGYNDEVANTLFKAEIMKRVLQKVDMRQFCTFSETQNRWSTNSAELSLGMIMTGYSYELSAERCVMDEL